MNSFVRRPHEVRAIQVFKLNLPKICQDLCFDKYVVHHDSMGNMLSVEFFTRNPTMSVTARLTDWIIFDELEGAKYASCLEVQSDSYFQEYYAPDENKKLVVRRPKDD